MSDAIPSGEGFIGLQSLQPPLGMIEGIGRAGHRLNRQRAARRGDNRIAGVDYDRGKRTIHHHLDPAATPLVLQCGRRHSLRITLQPDIAVIETEVADPATFAKIPLGILRIEDLAGRRASASSISAVPTVK